MLKAILFDMDGILYDSEYFYMKGTVDQMRKYGYTGDEKNIYRIIGCDMAGTYDILYKLLDGKVPMEHLIEGNEHYFGVLHPVPYKEIMFEGVDEVLRRLRALGLKTAVCSSSPKQTILDSLNAMGITELFDFIESSDETNATKPAPDVYLKARDYFGLRSEECLVYEDSTKGIQAGKNAGMRVIAREDLRYGQDQSHADIVVKDIYGLLKIVEGEVIHGRSN